MLMCVCVCVFCILQYHVDATAHKPVQTAHKVMVLHGAMASAHGITETIHAEEVKTIL